MTQPHPHLKYRNLYNNVKNYNQNIKITLQTHKAIDKYSLMKAQFIGYNNRTINKSQKHPQKIQTQIKIYHKIKQ